MSGQIGPKAAEKRRQETSIGRIRAALMGNLNEGKILDRVNEGLDAVVTYQRKDGTIVSRPDYSLRLKYLQFLTETVEGTPVQRREQINRNVVTTDEMEEKLRKSPALRKAMAKILEKAELDGAKKVNKTAQDDD